MLHRPCQDLEALLELHVAPRDARAARVRIAAAVGRTPERRVDPVGDPRHVLDVQFESGDQLFDHELGRRDQSIGLEGEPPLDRVDVGGIAERELTAVPHPLGAVHRRHERHPVDRGQRVGRPAGAPIVAVHDVGDPSGEGRVEVGERHAELDEAHGWPMPCAPPSRREGATEGRRRSAGPGTGRPAPCDHVGDPLGDRQDDDLVAGPGETRGEAVDVGRRTSRRPWREVPRQHQHSHGLAPYRQARTGRSDRQVGSAGRRSCTCSAARRARPQARSTVDAMSNVARPIGELDLHLFGEGTHRRLWELLGPQGLVIDGNGDAHGVRFSVWAPNASRVSVVGDWNNWSPEPLTMLDSYGPTGIWSGLAPAARTGHRYKFEIVTAEGRTLRKADPMARQAELPAERRERGPQRGAPRLARRRLDDRARRHACGAMRRCAPTRCTSGRGVAVSRTGTRSPTNWVTTSRRWGSPTSNCCPWPSIRSAARGATRCRGTTRRPPASAIRAGWRRFVDLDAPARHRRDRRLGAGALPARRVEPRPVRRHPAVRAPRSPAR